ncbi:hypothetical protein CRM22_000712 [Opisthorchis felineus]|uniref:EF-hand domain-containing protein n=1 Tax=Opisthorchis felineus TaxID=147828 RepID=A0A4S2ME27_OPIFE|nr:hypothetical protein CRM22_000712 [Opisthorchis felineus]
MGNTSTVKKASGNDNFVRHGLAVLFDNAAEKKEQDKIRIRKQLRHVSLDILATEWLNMEPRTIESRAYLIGNVLPQVVFGLEHILKEAVDRRLTGLEQTEQARLSEGADPNFNPINRLAEFLMRNNHKYSNFSETSPYVRGLRNTVAQLQQEMFMRSDNHLARLKAAAIKSKEDKLRRLEAEAEEQKRRRNCVTELFGMFLVRERETVEAAVIHKCIRIFVDLAVNLPEPLKQSLVPLYETSKAEETPTSYNQEEFVNYVLVYAQALSAEVFDKLVEYMKLCAKEYVSALRRERLRNVFTKLFASCNVSQISGMPREKLLDLCDTYFESAPADVKLLLRDPRDWPMQDYFLRVIQPELEKSENLRAESLKNITQGEENQFTRDQNNSASSCLLDAPRITMEAEAFNGAFPIGDVTTDERGGGKEVQNNRGLSNQPDDIISISLTRGLESCPYSLANYVLRNQHGLSVLSKLSTYLTLINGAEYTYSKRQFRYAYMSHRLTMAQFVHVMECFVKDNASDEVVQKLALYLKKNYTETSEWRENYGDKFRKMKFEEESNNVIARLFEIMDYKSTGFVHLSLVEQYVAQFEGGSFLASLECAKRKIQTFQSKQAQEYPVCNEELDFSMGDRTFDEPSAHELNSFQGKTPPLIDNANCTADTLINKQNLRILLRHTFSVNRLGESQSDLDTLSAFADFVKRQMDVGLQEKLKGDTRRHWLDAIQHEARVAHYSMEPVYRAVFKAIIRNTLTFGGNKPISAKIFLLQNMHPSSGKTILQCMAAIPDAEATSSVGKHLLGTHANICFQAMDYGCTMYGKVRVSQGREAEPRQSNMSSKPETLTCSEQTTPHQKLGLVVPISDSTRRSLGVLYILRPCDAEKHLMLEEDELPFYQAIANELGSAIDTVNLHKFLTHTVVAAFHWINQYLDSMEQVAYYWCLDTNKPNAATQAQRTLGDADEDEKQNIDQQSVQHRNCALVRLVTKHRNSAPVLHAKPEVLERSESYLDNYLFTVADTSEVVEQTSCQKHHFCYPVRDCEGVAVGIVDLCMKENKLSTEETEKVITMMAILSTVYGSQNRKVGTEVYQRKPEVDVDFGGEIAFSPSSFFKQVAAVELYELVRKLTPEVYNQIHSCASSSQVVLDIIAMVAEILNPQWTDCGGGVNTVDDQCRSIEKLLPGFSVTSTSNERHVIKLHRFFESHPATKVKYEIPYPIQLLYQWLRCYISLLEVIGSGDQ